MARENIFIALSIFPVSASFDRSYECVPTNRCFLYCLLSSFFFKPKGFSLFLPFSLCREKSTGMKEVPSQYPINNILNPRINLPVTWSHTLDTFSIHRHVLAKRVSSKTIHLTESVFSPYSSTVFRNFAANSHNTRRQHIDGLFFRR